MQDTLAGKPGGVLSPEMARTMLTPVRIGYGLGLIIGGSAAHPFSKHKGVDFGFVSLFVAYGSGEGAVTMTNGWHEWLVFTLMRSMAHEYGWPDFQPARRTIVAVDPNVLARYVGTFRFDPDRTVTVTQAGAELFMQVTGEPRSALLPDAQDDFFTRVSTKQIRFRLDAQEKATSLIMRRR